MVESMSRKERMARQAATINVIKVTPRPGNFCKYYVDPTKMPRAPVNKNPNALPAGASTMPVPLGINQDALPRRSPNIAQMDRAYYNFPGSKPRRGAPSMPP